MDRPVQECSSGEELTPKKALSWAVWVFLLPWRLIALFLLAVMIIPGVVMLCRLPRLAKENDLDLFLLSLRAIDRERTVRPLAPLGYQPAVQKPMADLTPDLHLGQAMARDFTLRLYDTRASQVTKVKAADGTEQYLVRFGHGATKKVPFTTPHFNVSREELDRAKKGVAAAFKSKARRAQLRQWGESLFWQEWLRVQWLSDVPYKLIPAPAGGTPEEQYWLAWTVLCGSSPAADEELPRLSELFGKAFPETADQQAALGWAKQLYTRMEEDFKYYQRYVKAQAGYKPNSHDKAEWVLAACETILPPKMNWTYYWLLYRYVGLSEASRVAAREHWAGCFPEGKHAEVQAFGEKVLQERRAAGEPLPPVPEMLPWLCAVERLVGTDAYGARCRAVLEREFGLYYAFMLDNGVLVANPNDDLFYLAAARDPLRLLANHKPGDTWENKIGRVGSFVFYIGVLLLGINWLIQFAARYALTARTRPIWEEHMSGRGKEPWWMSALGVLLCGGVGMLTAPQSLAEGIGMQMGSPEELFLGAMVATLVGGVIIATCRRVLALLLVGLGVDIEKTWLDEALGIGLGGLILVYFGNDYLAVGLFALSDLAPALLHTALERVKGHSVGAIPAAPEPVPAAVTAASYWPTQ